MYDRVVHMHESCEYDIVGERTGETFKTARVLKESYKRVKENKYARLKKKKKTFTCSLLIELPGIGRDQLLELHKIKREPETIQFKAWRISFELQYICTNT